MNISSSTQSFAQVKDTFSTKSVFTQKLSKEEVNDLRVQIKENTNAFSFKSTSIQMDISSQKDKTTVNYKDFQSFLKDIGYSGKPIAELSQDEAATLVGDNGIFGIKQTSERIANFVIQGAGGAMKIYCVLVARVCYKVLKMQNIFGVQFCQTFLKKQ